jgi:hypothetical protein
MKNWTKVHQLFLVNFICVHPCSSVAIFRIPLRSLRLCGESFSHVRKETGAPGMIAGRARGFK